MNKVLILDDRLERKKTHMTDAALKQLSICESSGWLNIITGEGVEKDKSFQYCSDYSLLAFHKSWLDSNSLLLEIERYAKYNNKFLIIFSGGISQTLLLNDYKDLRVNSADFYTGKLPDFIERYATSKIEQPLLRLLYGEAWQLPIFMKYRQLLWKGLPESDKDEEFILNFESILKEFGESTSVDIMHRLNIAIKKLIIKENII